MDLTSKPKQYLITSTTVLSVIEPQLKSNVEINHAFVFIAYNKRIAKPTWNRCDKFRTLKDPTPSKADIVQLTKKKITKFDLFPKD